MEEDLDQRSYRDSVCKRSDGVHKSSRFVAFPVCEGCQHSPTDEREIPRDLSLYAAIDIPEREHKSLTILLDVPSS